VTPWRPPRHLLGALCWWRPDERRLSEEERCRIVLNSGGRAGRRRTARFRCVIASPRPARCATPRASRGRIGHEARGENGFGYDPIFVVAGRDVTSAELPPDEKNAISHRGQAARAALEMLKRLPHDGPR
jgi:XTP/dITP diphosphohydrolase